MSIIEQAEAIRVQAQRAHALQTYMQAYEVEDFNTLDSICHLSMSDPELGHAIDDFLNQEDLKIGLIPRSQISPEEQAETEAFILKIKAQMDDPTLALCPYCHQFHEITLIERCPLNSERHN